MKTNGSYQKKNDNQEWVGSSHASCYGNFNGYRNWSQEDKEEAQFLSLSSFASGSTCVLELCFGVVLRQASVSVFEFLVSSV